MRTALVGLLLCLCAPALAPAPAFAQAPPSGAAARPQPIPVVTEKDRRWMGLFSMGKDSLTQQNYDVALRSFEEAYRLTPRPILLYYLGRVALGQQRHHAAVDLYRRFLNDSEEVLDPELRADAQAMLQGPREVACEVTVSGDAGAVLSVDGRLAGVLPLDLPILLPAGAHQFVLEKNRRKAETQVTLIARRRAEVRFTLVPPLALLTLTPGVLMLAPRTLDSSLASLLRRSVSEALSRENAVLVASDVQADLLTRETALLSCIDQPGCQERLAQKASAQFVLELQVQTGADALAAGSGTERPPGKPVSAFRFTARLLDVDVGVVSVQATQSCIDCGIKRALAQLGDMVQELMRQGGSRPRGTIKVDSEPPGAAVHVDGNALGQTPYQRDAFVGPHRVSVSKSGYTKYDSAVTVEDGQTLTVTAPLQAVATTLSSGPTRPTKILKWVFLGAGLAAVLAGGIVLGAGERQICNVGGSCMPSFNGRPAGIALLTLGGLSLVTSGGLFYYDARLGSQPTGTGTPGAPPASGGGVSLLGRF